MATLPSTLLGCILLKTYTFISGKAEMAPFDSVITTYSKHSSTEHPGIAGYRQDFTPSKVNGRSEL